jgi:hypothetical protein
MELSQTVNPAAVGRAAVWQLASQIKRGCSPWQLEYFKACLGQTEPRLGDLIVSSRMTNLADLPGERSAAIDFFHLSISAVLGLGMLLLQLIRFTDRRLNTLACIPGQTLLALHAEWSNRTRHLLTRINVDLHPSAIVVLGRPKLALSTVIRRWKRELDREPPPLLVPQSWASFFAVIRLLPCIFLRGFEELRRAPIRPTLREHSALAFRVFLGSVQQNWWQAHGVRDAEVLFGHTGLGDTTQLELEMQSKNCKTKHFLHGVCTGPNFVGFSDYAYFHCGLDARRYGELEHYRYCIAPPARLPSWKRGNRGILLVSNLAHPMNPGYRAHGVSDEVALLHFVVSLSEKMGPNASALYWKPHPIIKNLPINDQKLLREKAAALKIIELSSDQEWLTIASTVRWIFITPSTTIVDLLREGCLPLLLDWQGSAYDGVAAKLPIKCPLELQQCLSMLEFFDRDQNFQSAQVTAWAVIQPALLPASIKK